PATWWRWSSRSTPRCTWPPDRWPTCWTRRSRTWPAPESCTRGTGSTTPTPSSFPCTTPQATKARTGVRWPHPSPATSTTTRAICPPTTTSARTTLGSRGSPSACGRWRSDGREGRHPHRGPWRTGESGPGWGRRSPDPALLTPVRSCLVPGLDLQLGVLHASTFRGLPLDVRRLQDARTGPQLSKVASDLLTCAFQGVGHLREEPMPCVRCVFTVRGGVVPGDITPLAVQQDSRRVVDDLVPVGDVLFVEVQDAHPPTVEEP